MLSVAPVLFAWGIPGLALAAVVAAFIFAPVGSKRTLIEIAIVVGLASGVYGHGATYEQALCKSELAQRDQAHAAELGVIRDANLMAIAQAQAAAHAKADADAAALKSAIDEADHEADAAQDEADMLRESLDAMAAADPKAAAAPAPPMILCAIRGGCK